MENQDVNIAIFNHEACVCTWSWSRNIKTTKTYKTKYKFIHSSSPWDLRRVKVNKCLHLCPLRGGAIGIPAHQLLRTPLSPAWGKAPELVGLLARNPVSSPRRRWKSEASVCRDLGTVPRRCKLPKFTAEVETWDGFQKDSPWKSLIYLDLFLPLFNLSGTCMQFNSEEHVYCLPVTYISGMANQKTEGAISTQTKPSIMDAGKGTGQGEA